MKKIILIFLVLCCVQNVFAQQQDSFKVRISVPGTIKRVSEKGEFVSVISKDREKKIITAFLYDSTGKEIISIGEHEKDLMFAEYVKQFNYYIVILRGFESYEGYPETPDIIKAIDVTTGNVVWENNANAEHYEISPDGRFLVTKSPTEDDRKSSFVIINLLNGSKITPKENIQNYRAIWFDSNKVLIVCNEEKKIQPENHIREYENWREELRKKEKEALNDYNNKKIDKMTFENLEKEHSNEFFKKTNEYLDIISDETKYITTSRILIYNVITLTVEKEKLLSENSNNLVISFNANPFNIINVDEEQNIYIYCRLASKPLDENIYFFVKYNKELSLLWKTELLPLTSLYRYLLGQKPFYGLLFNNSEVFVEPGNGNIVSYEELKEKFSDIPSIATLENSGTDFYNHHSKATVDYTNNYIIFK